ncbi:dihydrofolate reductase family protein [Actinoplanes derwentensis]|nr:dihydrofolate reductase family protein [Actinoplanes derwentensis]GID89488.1 dihydrofolate reductase [Actinoplanes derwentensis]
MRKVVLYSLLSLDGVAENPDHYVLNWDDTIDDFLAQTIATQDAVLLGRRTYDDWAPYWPTATDEPFATFINKVRKFVATSRPPIVEWAATTVVTSPQPATEPATTTVVNSQQPVAATATNSQPLAFEPAGTISRPLTELVRDLKQQAGGDIGIHGSIRLARSLLAANLVDELRLVTTPVVADGGRHLFENDGHTRRWRLAEAVASPSGALLSRYQFEG